MQGHHWFMVSDPLHMCHSVSLINGKSPGFRENPAHILVLALYNCVVSGKLSLPRFVVNTDTKYTEIWSPYCVPSIEWAS